MQYPSYVPQPDALFATWLDNFSVKLTADPVAYGLVAGDALAVDGVNDVFQLAYALAIAPATRTSATIADKDAARVNAESVVRPYAVRVIQNPNVTNLARVELGVTVPTPVSTPVPAPTTAPSLILINATPLLHNLAYRDSTDPLVRAKPFGVLSLALYAQLGVTAGIDPDAATFVASYNKTPFQVNWTAENRGKHATFWGRWCTRSGPAGKPQMGPWSASLDAIII
jgi:hypothetical protein